jgi:hypothetical protein
MGHVQAFAEQELSCLLARPAGRARPETGTPSDLSGSTRSALETGAKAVGGADALPHEAGGAPKGQPRAIRSVKQAQVTTTLPNTETIAFTRASGGQIESEVFPNQFWSDSR